MQARRRADIDLRLRFEVIENVRKENVICKHHIVLRQSCYHYNRMIKNKSKQDILIGRFGALVMLCISEKKKTIN